MKMKSTGSMVAWSAAAPQTQGTTSVHATSTPQTALTLSSTPILLLLLLLGFDWFCNKGFVLVWFVVVHHEVFFCLDGLFHHHRLTNRLLPNRHSGLVVKSHSLHAWMLAKLSHTSRQKNNPAPLYYVINLVATIHLNEIFICYYTTLQSFLSFWSALLL